MQKNHIRKRILPITLLLALALLACIVVPAQTRFYIKVPTQKMSRQDVLQVDYVIENAQNIRDLNLPEYEHFNVVGGPNQSSETSSVNGKTTSSYTISLLLQPKMVGKFTIPGASATINGKPLQTGSAEIVVDNSKPKKTDPASSSPLPFNPYSLFEEEEQPLRHVEEEITLRPGEDATEKIRKNLLVTVDVSKKTCYEGEPIVATYKLYSRLNSESKLTKRPSLNGFSVYDMIMPENARPGVEKLNGKEYNTHIIRKVQLYPLQSGNFELDPAELDNVVKFAKETERPARGPRGNSLRDFLNDLMNPTPTTWEEHKLTLSSPAISITVKPLPLNKPSSFNGAVGDFSISATILTKQIHAGDNASLEVVIKGKGNLPLVNAPTVQFPTTWETYDPDAKEELDKTVAPITGSKTFTYNFTANDSGNYIIPPIVFSYFDPSSAGYKTIETESFKVHVLPGTVRKRAPAVVNNATQTAAAKSVVPVWAWGLMGVMLSAIIILVVRKNKRGKAKAAAAEMATTDNTTQAVDVNTDQSTPVVTSLVNDFLETSRQALLANDSRTFYNSLHQAIWHKISEAVQESPTSLTKPAAMAGLLQKGVAPAVVEDLQTLLTQCEMALYTPVHTSGDMRFALDKTKRLLEGIVG